MSAGRAAWGALLFGCFLLGKQENSGSAAAEAVETLRESCQWRVKPISLIKPASAVIPSQDMVNYCRTNAALGFGTALTRSRERGGNRRRQRGLAGGGRWRAAFACLETLGAGLGLSLQTSLAGDVTLARDLRTRTLIIVPGQLTLAVLQPVQQGFRRRRDVVALTAFPATCQAASDGSHPVVVADGVDQCLWVQILRAGGAPLRSDIP